MLASQSIHLRRHERPTILEMRWDDGVALPCRSQAKATGVKRKTPHAFISGDEDAAGVNAGLW